MALLESLVAPGEVHELFFVTVSWKSYVLTQLRSHDHPICTKKQVGFTLPT
jgi:hypothetical protein